MRTEHIFIAPHKFTSPLGDYLFIAMKYQVYKTTLNFTEQKKKLINTSIVGLSTISVFITAVWFYPNIYSYIAGAVSLITTAFYIYKAIHHRQVILNIDENALEYLDENDELVSIAWNEILKVSSSFGELEFFTEQGRKKLDLSFMKSQDRWEVKNIISNNSRIMNFQFR